MGAIPLKNTKTTTSQAYQKVIEHRTQSKNCKVYEVAVNPVTNASYIRYRIKIGDIIWIDNMSITTEENWPFGSNGGKMPKGTKIGVYVRSSNGTSVTLEAMASLTEGD